MLSIWFAYRLYYHLEVNQDFAITNTRGQTESWKPAVKYDSDPLIVESRRHCNAPAWPRITHASENDVQCTNRQW